MPAGVSALSTQAKGGIKHTHQVVLQHFCKCQSSCPLCCNKSNHHKRQTIRDQWTESLEPWTGEQCSFTSTGDAATSEPNTLVSLWQGQMQNLLRGEENVQVLLNNGRGTPARKLWRLSYWTRTQLLQLAANDPDRVWSTPSIKFLHQCNVHNTNISRTSGY